MNSQLRIYVRKNPRTKPDTAKKKQQRAHLIGDGDSSTNKKEAQLRRASVTEGLKKRIRRRKPEKDTVYKCAVCGDTAHGYNFNAITCESCKAFFRRNCMNPSFLEECPNNQSCHITKSTRRCCPACRFNLCLKIGMKRDSVSSEDVQPLAVTSATSCDEAQDSIKSLPSESGDVSECLVDVQSVASRPDQPMSNIAATESSLPSVNSLSQLDAQTTLIDSKLLNACADFDVFNSAYEICRSCSSRLMLLHDGNELISGNSDFGFGERIAIQFVGFVKTLADFTGLHPDRQFNLLQANFIASHVVNYGFVVDLFLEDVYSRLPKQLTELHRSIRARFAHDIGKRNNWPVLLSTFSLIHLFSPLMFIDFGSAKTYTNTDIALIQPNSFAGVLVPIQNRYLRFLRQYLRSNNCDEVKVESDWQFCMKALNEFRTISDQIARSYPLGKQTTSVIAKLLYLY